MSQICFVYDQYGNITEANTSYPQVTPPAQLLIADSVNTPNANYALAQPKNYMIQNGQIVPAVTVEIDRVALTAGRWNQYQIITKASDEASHPITLTIGGHTLQVTTPSTTTIDLHQTLLGVQIPITVSGQGIITNTSHIGGSGSASFQVYPDTTSADLKIAPTTRNGLLGYYASKASPLTAMADIMTGMGLIFNDLYGRVIPALTAGTTPLLTNSDNQNNAVKDIQANINAKAPVTLETAAPVPASGSTQEYDLHYASLSRHWGTMEQAFTDYAADVQEIPNLA